MAQQLEEVVENAQQLADEAGEADVDENVTIEYKDGKKHTFDSTKE